MRSKMSGPFFFAHFPKRFDKYAAGGYKGMKWEVEAGLQHLPLSGCIVDTRAGPDGTNTAIEIQAGFCCPNVMKSGWHSFPNGTVGLCWYILIGFYGVVW